MGEVLSELGSRMNGRILPKHRTCTGAPLQTQQPSRL